MKSKITGIKLIVATLISTTILSGCGIHQSMVANVNSNVTNVELNKKNFKVVERVSGSSNATYILGIGGLSNKALINKAESAMLSKASLNGSAKAIANVSTESHISLVFPFYFQKTVTVSGHIVEFTE